MLNSLDRFRAWSLPQLPLHVFLIAYFFTVLLGNILYATPFGHDLPKLNIQNWQGFGAELGVGFWELMLLPVAFILLVLVVGKLASPIAEKIEPAIPEFPLPLYLLMTGGLSFFVVAKLAEMHAVSRFFSGGNAISAVENRFALLADLGQSAQVSMKSLLVFLSIYGLIRAVRSGQAAWYIATGLTSVVLFVCLILLNMKWPPVIFVLTLGICLFVASEKRPYLKAGALTAIGIALYFTLSVVVLRWFPESPVQKPPVAMSEQREEGRQPPARSPSSEPNAKALSIDSAQQIIEGVQTNSLKLALVGLNRMAISAPYFFEFSEFAGASCQPTLERLWIKRDISCEPSLLVYSKVFGRDGFEGRGTAPAAINLYGYALAGWEGAMISTGIASVILGLFLSLWSSVKRNSVFAAAFVMGCYTAYFFSQLPVEGAILYDHGMLWWTVLVLAWSALHGVFSIAATMVRGVPTFNAVDDLDT